MITIYLQETRSPVIRLDTMNVECWAHGWCTVVSERKLINVWLIELNEEFKHAIKGQSEISTLRAKITGKILDNLRVWRITCCRCNTEMSRRIRIEITVLCQAKENMGSLALIVTEKGVEFFQHRKVYTVLKKYCS